MIKAHFTSLRNIAGRASARVLTGRGGKLAARAALFSLLLILIIQGARAAYRRYIPSGGTGPDTVHAAPADDAVGYYRVDPKNVEQSIHALGQIVYHEKVNVSSKVNGRLDRLYVKEGSRVVKGQAIAEIERLPLELSLREQEAELDIAKNSHDLAKAKYENALRAIEIRFAQIRKARAEVLDKKASFDNMSRTLSNKAELFKAGGISETEYEAVKAQHTSYRTRYANAVSDLEIQEVGFRDEDIAASGHRVPGSREEKIKLFQMINTKMEKAEMEAALSKIRQVEQSIRSTRTLIAETYIRAPFTGVVAVRGMEAGEIVKSDSIIVSVMDISSVFLSVQISEKDAKEIREGQEALFTADAFAGEDFTGRVSRITPVFDSKTRTFEVKALVRNPGLRLMPGMFARAKIITGKKNGALLLPLSALLSKEADEGEVFLVKKGIVFKQKIGLGREYDGSIEAVKGLSPGDIVVARGTGLVHAEMKADNMRLMNE